MVPLRYVPFRRRGRVRASRREVTRPRCSFRAQSLTSDSGMRISFGPPASLRRSPRATIRRDGVLADAQARRDLGLTVERRSTRASRRRAAAGRAGTRDATMSTPNASAMRARVSSRGVPWPRFPVAHGLLGDADDGPRGPLGSCPARMRNVLMLCPHWRVRGLHGACRKPSYARDSCKAFYDSTRSAPAWSGYASYTPVITVSKQTFTTLVAVAPRTTQTHGVTLAELLVAERQSNAANWNQSPGRPKLLGVTQQSVSKWEQGTATPGEDAGPPSPASCT